MFIASNKVDPDQPDDADQRTDREIGPPAPLRADISLQQLEAGLGRIDVAFKQAAVTANFHVLMGAQNSLLDAAFQRRRESGRIDQGRAGNVRRAVNDAQLAGPDYAAPDIFMVVDGTDRRHVHHAIDDQAQGLVVVGGLDDFAEIAFAVDPDADIRQFPPRHIVTAC